MNTAVGAELSAELEGLWLDPHHTHCPFSVLQQLCKDKVLVLQGIVPE